MTQSDRTDRPVVLALIYAAAAEHFGPESPNLTEATDLWDDLGADDLDEVEFILLLEEKFDIDIADGEIGNYTDDAGMNMSSLGHCADVVMRAASK